MRNVQHNPNANQFRRPAGYTDLGFNPCNSPEVKACRDKGHKIREFDNSLYLYRCTDVVNICDECKMVWHIDCSD